MMGNNSPPAVESPPLWRRWGVLTTLLALAFLAIASLPFTLQGADPAGRSLSPILLMEPEPIPEGESRNSPQSRPTEASRNSANRKENSGTESRPSDTVKRAANANPRMATSNRRNSSTRQVSAADDVDGRLELSLPPTPGMEAAPAPVELPPSPSDRALNGDRPLRALPVSPNSPTAMPRVQRKPASTSHYVPRSQLPEKIGHASGDCDGSEQLRPFQHRVAMQQGDEQLFDQDIPPIPIDFEPWWIDAVGNPHRVKAAPLKVELDSLILIALQYSPQILSVRSDQGIRETVVCEEFAQFDWRAFLDNRWNDLNDPVGNTLITGGPNRYKNKLGTSTAGVRKKTETGGTFEASQQLGWQHTNSKFFIPPYQGQTRLQLSYTQPLLNGAGEAYNHSRIVLAQLDADGTRDEILGQLQDHLMKVTEAYWDLYRARAIYFQRSRMLGSASHILDTLEGRQDVDAQQRQVLRARASVLRRRSDIARAEASIRNAEARLRLLVNAPQMTSGMLAELVPLDSPTACCSSLRMADSLQTALVHRPDISQAIRSIRATSVRLCVAENEILPKLDLILSTYVAGLAGESDVGNAYTNQFQQGRPSYTAGLLFEVPIGNRAARATLERRELELRKAMNEFQATVETGLTEVELAVREAQTSAREVVAKYHAMAASDVETSYLNERWLAVPGTDRSATRLLEDLLDSQERLADSETEFVTAQVSYLLAMAKVRHVMGTLLEVADDVSHSLVPTQGTADPEDDDFTSKSRNASGTQPASYTDSTRSYRQNPTANGDESGRSTRNNEAPPAARSSTYTPSWNRLFKK